MTKVWILECRTMKDDSVIIAIATSEENLSKMILSELSTPEFYTSGEYFVAYDMETDTTEIQSHTLRYFTRSGKLVTGPVEALKEKLE